VRRAEAGKEADWAVVSSLRRLSSATPNAVLSSIRKPTSIAGALGPSIALPEQAGGVGGKHGCRAQAVIASRVASKGVYGSLCIGHAWALSGARGTFRAPEGLFGPMGSPSRSNGAWGLPSEDPPKWHHVPVLFPHASWFFLSYKCLEPRMAFWAVRMPG
jgi:hypothetical protein